MQEWDDSWGADKLMSQGQLTVKRACYCIWDTNGVFLVPPCSPEAFTSSSLFDREREQPPRFAQPGSFEYEYAMRWKALIEMEKQQQEQVDRNIKEAREKLEMEMEAARHEHQVMLMRQGTSQR